MRQQVFVIGYGQSPFGYKYIGYEPLLHQIAQNTIKMAGISPSLVDFLYVATAASSLFNNQALLAAILSGAFPEWHGKPGVSCENACASSMTALKLGFDYCSRTNDSPACVYVTGYEEMYTPKTVDASGEKPVTNWKLIGEILGTCAHAKYRKLGGLIFPRYFARLTKQFIDQYPKYKEVLGLVAVKNRAHGRVNPLAQVFGKPELTLEKAMEGNLFSNEEDCFLPPSLASLVTNGCTGLLLCNNFFLEKNSGIKSLAQLEDVQLAVQPLDLAEKGDLFNPEILLNLIDELTKATSFIQGGQSVTELHDCFAVVELIMAATALGLELPDVLDLYQNDEMYFNGTYAINTSGGRMGMGHPVGATGLAMIIELVLQILGQATGRQVPNAITGLAVNMGGPFSAWGGAVVSAIR